MPNKRKFKHWDNQVLFHSLQKAIQLRHMIEEQCHIKQAAPDALPPSMLPTHILYELAACYEAMYDKLLEEELITSGYSKTLPIKH